MERSRLARSSRPWLKKLTSAVFAISLVTFSHAQDAPVADVAVRYSPLYILRGYTIWLNGGSGTVAFNTNNWFGVAGDVGVYHGYPSESLTGETYTFGPRFTYRNLDRIVPFAQALFGGSHFSASSGGITGGGTEFTFSLGGGSDIALRGSQRLALRLEGDYFGIRSSGSTTPAVRLSAGIVYHLGDRAASR